jgi:hypothetical protein
MPKTYDVTEALHRLGQLSEDVNHDDAGASAAADLLLAELATIASSLPKPLNGVLIGSDPNRGVRFGLTGGFEDALYVQHNDKSGTLEIAEYAGSKVTKRTAIKGLRFNPVENRLEGEQQDSFLHPRPGGAQRPARAALAVVVDEVVRQLRAKLSRSDETDEDERD